MKVLMFNGSPRENGCTNAALKIIADQLKKEGIESKIICVGNKNVSGVGAGEDDSFIREIAGQIKDYDGFVFGSPVYYASPNGTMISFLDRLFATCKDFALKPACCVVSCRRGGATASVDVLNKYPMFYNMPLISSNYWNMVHGNSPKEVLKDEEGVQTMELLGRNMAYFLKCIKCGKENNIFPPEIPNKIKTNYIR